MIETVYCDLDGPLLDTQLRQFRCYEEILHTLGFAAMDCNRYWTMKRDRRALHEQLAVTGAEPAGAEFRTRWLERIESPDLLALDSVHAGAAERLESWRRRGIRIVVVSLRQNREGALQQLETLALAPLIDLTLIVPHARGASGKAAAVRESVADFDPRQSLWIGDTEVDVAAARDAGCAMWGVGCGIRTVEYLSAMGADRVSQTLVEVDVDAAFA
jgi:phosphoglycolate phosphatase-like HAD superfamily hydrolase